MRKISVKQHSRKTKYGYTTVKKHTRKLSIKRIPLRKTRKYPNIKYDEKWDHYILYHGTSAHLGQKILKEGLKGGDNTGGGNRGTWDHPILFLVPHPIIAKKYGEVLEVHLTEEEVDKLEQINDGLGDRCYLLHGTEWDKILFTPDRIEWYLTEAEKIEEAHDEGICYDDCPHCDYLFVSNILDDETFKFDKEIREWEIADSSDKATKSPFLVATDDEDLAKEFYGNYKKVKKDDLFYIKDISKHHHCDSWDYAVLLEEKGNE